MLTYFFSCLVLDDLTWWTHLVVCVDCFAGHGGINLYYAMGVAHVALIALDLSALVMRMCG